jgi:uncharacterized protein with NRDE domain
MCLIFFAVEVSPEMPFCLLANRDEFYSRPTEPMHWWEDIPVLAGKDLQAGGTWLAISKSGRVAAVTNYRNPEHVNPAAPSRGKIPVDAVLSQLNGKETIEELKSTWMDCNGFNLILHDGKSTFWYSNVLDEIRQLEKGVYGLSNAFLDTPWPKVSHGKAAFHDWLLNDSANNDAAFRLMANTQTYPEDALPDTGVGAGVEKMLSAACIVSPIYGTRCTTLVRKNVSGLITVMEKNLQNGELKQFVVMN